MGSKATERTNRSSMHWDVIFIGGNDFKYCGKPDRSIMCK